MKESRLSYGEVPGRGLPSRLSALLLAVCLIFAGAFESKAQNRTVTGTVSDSQGTLAGASVLVKGTSSGTFTTLDGTWSLDVAPNSVLVFGFIGFKDQEVNIGDRMVIDVVLEPDSEFLQDAVVVGYGSQKRTLVTGAISSVSGESLDKVGVVNAGDALSGKTSGVQIISDSGQPGAGVQIVVRGVGSNNSNGNNPIYIVDGMAVSGISYLNPYDIESMEILKDAASAAIYGARGGNGVVIITTKKGKEGKCSINYNFSYGVSNIPHKLSLLDAQEYMTIRNEMSVNAGLAPQFSDEDMKYYKRGTDWQEAILNRNAGTMQHSISCLGGSKRTSYSLSASYLDQNGLFAKDKSNFKRYTVSFNGEQRFLKNDVLKIGQNVVVTRVSNKSISSNTLLGGGALTSALNMDPLTPVYDDYSQYSDYADNKEYYDLFHGFAYSRFMNPDYHNPAASVYFSNPKSYWTTLKGNIYAELTLFKDLKIRGSFGADMTWTQTYSYTMPRRLNQSTYYNQQNGTSQSSSERQTFNSEVYMTYSKLFKDKHDFSAMIGTQLIQRSGLSLSGSRDGLLTTDPDKAYLSLAKGANQAASGGPSDPSALLSFFGRVNYAYDNRYMATVTVRRDGSSRFGSNNRFATFPSVSVGWNISNESFFRDNVSWVDYLKLRFSWGQNGNENIGNFAYLSNVSTSSQLGYVFGASTATEIATGGAPVRLSNPDLKWETSEQFDLGVDLTFLRNWKFTLDLYSKTTKDQLVTSPIPLFLGAGFPVVNAGEVKNRGIELMLSYERTFDNGLYVNASANMTYNKNKVTYVGTDSKFVSGLTVTGIGEVSRMEEGYPMGYFKGLDVVGVFQNWDEVNSYTWTDPETGVTKLIQPDAVPGDLKFRDVNSDGSISSLDRTDIGNPYPKILYGFNLSLGWKNIDFSISTSGAALFQIFSAVRRNQSANNWGTWILDRWTGEGTSNTIPRLTDDDKNNNWGQASSLYVCDGDYFRIRNISLGYTFNIDEKYYVRKVRLFASVANPVVFTRYNRGYDPEIGQQSPLSVGTDLGNYPRPITASVGLNLTF